VPTVISNPASFTSVRNAFQTRGYGAVNNSLLAYRQGGGIVPSSSAFDGIGAGTSGDPLRLSQFSGFSVPDLLRFTTPYTGVNGGKFNIASRASTGSGSRPMYAYFALRTNKTADWGGNSVTVWNTNGATAGDAPNMGTFYAWGPNSWGSADVTSSGYEARVNVTAANFGGGDLVWYNAGGTSHNLSSGYSPYITLSSNTVLELTENSGGVYAYGTVEIRSIAFPSVQISTDFYLEAEGDA
jgi:hypothetical protein